MQLFFDFVSVFYGNLRIEIDCDMVMGNAKLKTLNNKFLLTCFESPSAKEIMI